MAEKREFKRRDSKNKSRSKAGRNYLFAIGIDNYKHIPKLDNAVRDVNSFCQILLDKYQFEEKDKIFLLNEKATYKKIKDTLKELATLLTPKDNLIIFYCGHGIYDKILDQGYWVPVDAYADSVAGYISNSDLVVYLKAIKTLHTLIISDSCFSGTLFSRSRDFSEKVETIPSRWGLASGRNEAVSDGSHGKNSPFTENLIYFLENNQDEKIPVSRLVQYVKEATANNSAQTPLGSPLQNVGDRGGEFVFRKKGFILTDTEDDKDKDDETPTTKTSDDDLNKKRLQAIGAGILLVAVIVLVLFFTGVLSGKDKQSFVPFAEPVANALGNKDQILHGHGSGINYLATSGSDIFLTGDQEGRFVLWNHDGEFLWSEKFPGCKIDFIHTDRSYVSVEDPQNKTLRLFEVRDSIYTEISKWDSSDCSGCQPLGGFIHNRNFALNLSDSLFVISIAQDSILHRQGLGIKRTPKEMRFDPALGNGGVIGFLSDGDSESEKLLTFLHFNFYRSESKYIRPSTVCTIPVPEASYGKKGLREYYWHNGMYGIARRGKVKDGGFDRVSDVYDLYYNCRIGGKPHLSKSILIDSCRVISSKNKSHRVVFVVKGTRLGYIFNERLYFLDELNAKIKGSEVVFVDYTGWFYDDGTKNHPDMAVVTADGRLIIHNQLGKSPQLEHQLELDPSKVAVSSNGGWFAIGGKSGKVTIIDKYGERLYNAKNAHSGKVNEIRFTQNMKRLVTVSSDSTIRIWEIPPYNEQLTNTKYYD